MFSHVASTGVEKQGAPGFFKGIGKGVTGVLLKPAGGVFDSVSVLLDGFRRATQTDAVYVERVRLPRETIPTEVSRRGTMVELKANTQPSSLLYTI